MSHTPGPWTVEFGTNNGWEVNGSGHRIAVESWHGDLSHIKFKDQYMADARLIAAAPDLLEALQGILPEGWGDDDTMDHMPGVKAARLAIAKATT